MTSDDKPGMLEAVTFSISLKGWSYQHPSLGIVPHVRLLGVRHMTVRSARPQASSFMKGAMGSAS